MSLISDITRTSATVLLLASAAVADDAAERHVSLQCDAQDRAHDMGPMCEALGEALAAAVTGYAFKVMEGSSGVSKADEPPAEAALTLHFTERGRADSWLSGQLSWSSADGRKGDSPVLEYSVMDRQLNAEDLASFAQQLIRSANIPKHF
ncbi:hypothetical protein PXK00_17860 [Phaeobacter sp. QD34_3]|uniref:hypothetical protein n=1 Tax=unclassified Phaeobacter TaxID=2621772 RepID=UPI00237EEC2E|nr:MULTISPECIES: hypothetical protein [unclassified Phaeobacter]MDE4134980.1 hypothetical protein [Phaeobacter sp. QD34_3]MDE4138610.1 hypothetical protein [Phaeobacter sp. QD34_24]MDE4176666.1 hypothetical protein [Phaeobacter sp. PT47_59]